MKKIICSIILLFLFASVGCAEESRYKVIKVIDGDTVYVDFNKNGIPEREEKVRINGIDTFETRVSDGLKWQMNEYALTQDEAIGLGYYGKEFAKKELLNKYVIAEYTANSKLDKNDRKLMSVYYDCKNGHCKSYEQEILKAGLAVVYRKSNIAETLKNLENIDKIKAYAKKSHRLNLVLLNKNTKKYHHVNCQSAKNLSNAELINKPLIGAKPALCCHHPKYKKYIDIEKSVPDIHTEYIDIYFQNPLKYKKPANYARTSAAQRLLQDLNNAKSSIEFAIYGIGEQPEIFNSLVIAKNKGLNIIGVTDMDKFNQNEYSDTKKLIYMLGPNILKTDYFATKKAEEDRDKFIKKYSRQNGDYKGFTEKITYSLGINKIDIKITPKNILSVQQGIMHNKVFVIDKKIVWTGSTNISSRGTGGYNANVMARIESPVIADLYSKEINQMNKKERFHQYKFVIKNNENIQLNDDTKISVYFLPKHKPVEKAIRPLLKNAKSRIYIPMFYLTHRNIISDLIEIKQNNNVDIAVILDATGAQNIYTKHHLLREAGIPVYVENWGGKMHMKSAIIDDVFILGSMNWTKAGTTNNDENIVIIHNKEIADKAAKYFKELEKSIPKKWLINDPLPESFDSINSCKDGIDNDHDGLIDTKSPFCSYK